MAYLSWYVVLAQGRVVHGVYGSALKEMAEAKVKEMERDGVHAFIEPITGRRPEVGDQL